MELIDRQSALSVCKEYCWTDDEVFIAGYNTAIKDTEVKLSKLPTIEAEPVRHGHWVNDTFCSECNRFPVDVSFNVNIQKLAKYFSYCPHCGVKMEDYHE